MPTAKELVSGAVRLVSLPAIYWDVKRVVDDLDATANDLAGVILTDPATTARVLRLANSAFWGSRGSIWSVPRAVAQLGMTHVHDLVLASSVASVFKGVNPSRMDVSRFWSGSVFRAVAAAALARECDLLDMERPFVEGLLSDIGHMVLYQHAPKEAMLALERSREQPWMLPQLERELIGCDYAHVGGALTEAWGLPLCFRAAIEHQDAPGQAADHAMESALLHIAGRLAHNELGDGRPASRYEIAPVIWEITGLTESCMPEIIREATMNLPSVARMFLPAAVAV